ncbi:MAG: DUF6678 family protein [bacterium]
MSTHGREELDREGRAVAANTRASLMSDTKWRKVLAALDQRDLELRQCIVKFVGDAAENVMSRPIGLHPPRPWVDTFQFGPIPLRSIEWMLFPRVAEYDRGDRTLPKQRVDQEIDEAKRIVDALGLYPAELTERGLLLTGYLRADGS